MTPETRDWNLFIFFFFDQRNQHNTTEAEELIKNRHK